METLGGLRIYGGASRHLLRATNCATTNGCFWLTAPITALVIMAGSMDGLHTVGFNKSVPTRIFTHEH